MLSNVYTPSAQHVVIVHYDRGRTGIAAGSIPITEHCCRCFFLSRTWIGRNSASIHGGTEKCKRKMDQEIPGDRKSVVTNTENNPIQPQQINKQAQTNIRSY
mmetsp:Transcript_10306/g.30184  ORF Transcript_10306/g.30184 Transcript_10306/m.30184 type:complete len:102 (+) Transcript_10306:1609-1914(+)